MAGGPQRVASDDSYRWLKVGELPQQQIVPKAEARNRAPSTAKHFADRHLIWKVLRLGRETRPLHCEP